MDEKFLEKYADVLLEAVNLQRGQCLLVRGEPVHARFAGIVARQAYKHGAKYVRFDNNEIENPYLYEERIKHSSEEYLEYVFRGRIETMERMIEENWALIAIRTPEDPDFLENLDEGRNARTVRAMAKAMQRVQERVSANEIAWLVAFMPTEKLAAKIMEMESGQGAVDALWKVLIPILRLDRNDPAASFRDHCDVLAARASRLNSLKLDSVRFMGPGTDLLIGLSERSEWRGGPDITKEGLKFNPNIPTEEVFTSPDFRRAEGTVKFTRPVLVPIIGKIIRGGRLDFRNGEVVAWDAESGKEIFDSYFGIDQGARRLGEVALVDVSSPINASGRIFWNILFDENASCHIALGSSYPSCFRDGARMTSDEKKAIGANESSVHTDFMIGGSEVSVTGITQNGESVDIIRHGSFVI